MKIIKHIGMSLFAIAVFIVIFVSTAKWAIFSDYQYYQNEYEKYNVAEKMNMEMENIMDVTHEMLYFLEDKREYLNVTTIVDGQSRAFFSVDEQTHMQDVKDIFEVFLVSRIIAILYIFLSVILFTILIHKKINSVRQILVALTKHITIVFGVILLLVSAIVIYCMIDFSAAFEAMHRLLFTNELWLMDPKTSLLINMLPEGFFADMAVRISLSVGTVFGIVFLTSLISWIITRKGQDSKKCALC